MFRLPLSAAMDTKLLKPLTAMDDRLGPVNSALGVGGDAAMFHGDFATGLIVRARVPANDDGGVG